MQDAAKATRAEHENFFVHTVDTCVWVRGQFSEPFSGVLCGIKFRRLKYRQLRKSNITFDWPCFLIELARLRTGSVETGSSSYAKPQRQTISFFFFSLICFSAVGVVLPAYVWECCSTWVSAIRVGLRKSRRVWGVSRVVIKILADDSRMRVGGEGSSSVGGGGVAGGVERPVVQPSRTLYANWSRRQGELPRHRAPVLIACKC